MFLRFFIAVILLSICDHVLGASVNVTESLLTVKNSTKLDNSTKPQNESVHPSIKVRGSDVKLKKLRFNVTDALSAVNATLNSTSDFSLLKNASMGGRAVKVQQLLKHKLKANMTQGNVSSNSSLHLNSTGNSTDALQIKNASRIVEREVFVVMFDNKQALLDIANNTSEDTSNASDFSLQTYSSLKNETESGKLLDLTSNSNSSAMLGEL